MMIRSYSGHRQSEAPLFYVIADVNIGVMVGEYFVHLYYNMSYALYYSTVQYL